MNRMPRATSRSHLAHPVASALRRTAVQKLDPLTMDLQALEALQDLRNGQVSWFSGQVLVAILSISRKLATAGIGPEALPTCNWCQALLVRANAGQALRPDQLRAFEDLVQFNQAQREADPEAFKAAALPFVR